MPSFPIVRYRALDNNGDPLNAGELYFYETGTVTPLPTYSDEALSSANANPVVADANGIFGAIYMKTDQEYTVVLKDSSGNTIWTEDNVDAGQLTSAGIVTRMSQATSNPLDQGAVGDGGQDETTEVQAALNAATGTCDLLGKTYLCNSGLTIPSGVTLKNGTLDFTSCTDNEYIQIAGTVGAQAELLTSNTAVTDSKVDVADEAGFSQGDLVLITSDDTWTGTTKLGGVYHVISTASTEIKFDTNVEAVFTTANSAVIELIAPKTNIRLENLKILCSPAASGTGRAIKISAARNIVIDNCTITGPKETGIAITKCKDVWVQNCLVSHDNAGSARGISCGDGATNVYIKDNTVAQLNKGIEFGRVITKAATDRRIFIEGNNIHDCATGIQGSAVAQFVHMSRNHITAGTTVMALGIVAKCIDWVIENNHVAFADNYGVYASLDVDDVNGSYAKILHNTFDTCASSSGKSVILAQEESSAAGIITKLQIIGNTMYGHTGNNIELGTGSTAVPCQQALIKDNMCSLGEYGVWVHPNADWDVPGSLTISGNEFDRCDTGITANNNIGVRIVISDNIINISATDTHGIDLTGFTITRATPFTVTGNKIHQSVVGTTSTGIKITGDGSATINGSALVGNTVEDCAYGIWLNTGNMNNILIASSVIEGTTDALRLQETTADDFDAVLISGCVLVTGTNHINVTNASNHTQTSLYDGVVFSGVAKNIIDDGTPGLLNTGDEETI